MFEDRRNRDDRRQLRGREASPTEGCRRHGERRRKIRKYHPQPWWLQIVYAEEVEPPLLDSNNDTSEY